MATTTKKTTKKTTKTTAPKTSKKTPAKTTAKTAKKGTNGISSLTDTQKEALKKAGISYVQCRILTALSKSKTKGHELAKPGELMYKHLAAESGVGIGPMTKLVAAASNRGTVHSDSLESKGLVSCSRYETETGSSTGYLFSITPKGKEVVKSVKL